MNAKSLDARTEIRKTLEHAQQAIKRAKDRTDQAVGHAVAMRESMGRMRAARPEVWDAGRKAMALMQLAAEESARAIFEKDRFLAVASHELRQPLGAAEAALEVLEMSQSEAAAARARAVLRRQLRHMARLVDDLLDMSRYALQSSELQKARVDLRRILDRAIEITAASLSAGGVALHLASPAEPAWVHGDETRLLQVFTNLLTNAARYTPPGGSVTVSLQPNGDLIVAEVADTGRGIDPEDLPHLFEPFARGHDAVEDGLGIGLALVRGIIERHGESVAAMSDGVGRGSRFTVVLPAMDETAGDEQVAP